MFKNHRDLLAILLGVIIFPAVWVLQGMGFIALPGEIIGVTVSIETMIAIFYFRKKGTNDSVPPTP